uniref:Uncharacterized protein n=1 Tax=Anguilla anguilla TaxID=7936 RepID=A0A0E9PU23_ANGAN
MKRILCALCNYASSRWHYIMLRSQSGHGVVR